MSISEKFIKPGQVSMMDGEKSRLLFSDTIFIVKYTSIFVKSNLVNLP